MARTAGRTAMLAVAGLLAVLGSAGCHDSSGTSSASSTYCDDLKAAKTQFAGLLNDTIDQQTFDAFGATLTLLTDEAPSHLTADWTTFGTAVQKFRSAMKQAGLTIEDMQDMGTGPMTGKAMQKAMAVAAALGAAKVSTAVSAIVDDASSNCGFDLLS